MGSAQPGGQTVSTVWLCVDKPPNISLLLPAATKNPSLGPIARFGVVESDKWRGNSAGIVKLFGPTRG